MSRVPYQHPGSDHKIQGIDAFRDVKRETRFDIDAIPVPNLDCDIMEQCGRAIDKKAERRWCFERRRLCFVTGDDP